MNRLDFFFILGWRRLRGDLIDIDRINSQFISPGKGRLKLKGKMRDKRYKSILMGNIFTKMVAHIHYKHTAYYAAPVERETKLT